MHPSESQIDPRYPLGKFQRPERLTAEDREGMIGQIADTPANLRNAVRGLSDEQLDTPYRDGGWTVRQVVHHVPDSHMNSYIRFHWALTETDPLIKAYEEADWAELPDARTGPVDVSLSLLDALHARWVLLLREMTEADWARTLQHPVNGRMTLSDMLAIYAWHGQHHVAQITSLRRRMGWE